jgi:hypothetical protein
MAKANNNVILSHLSGTIGDQLTIRQIAGTTIVSKAQKERKKKGSEKQLNAQSHFKDATDVAKLLMRDPDIKALYQAAAGPRQTAYNIAVGDAYSPPEITGVTTSQYLGKAGDKITVRAIDDFRVYQVVVSIYSAAGALIEQGPAIPARNGKDWIYAAIKENNGLKGTLIKAMAEDIPGNKTYSEVVL